MFDLLEITLWLRTETFCVDFSIRKTVESRLLNKMASDMYLVIFPPNYPNLVRPHFHFVVLAASWLQPHRHRVDETGF